MGLVLNQSFKNTLITYLGFGIGSINTLFLFPQFLGDVYYAVTGYISSASNIIMPILAFGMQNTLIKFYSHYKTEEEKSIFLSFTILTPILLCIPLFLITMFFFNDILFIVSKKNPIVKHFIWLIPFIGLCMGYFEIFYAWVRVHMHSVFGNFLKEVGLRLISLIFLLAVYYKKITVIEFIYLMAFTYLVALIAMIVYSFYVKRPVLKIRIPHNTKEILIYTFYIVLSGSIANLLLDVDKIMLNQYIEIENIAYYSVATYIALIISVPSRSMHQITYPITAKLMHTNQNKELNELYKKTSINLQVVGGFVMLCIFININQLYLLLPKDYSNGIWVVFMIGLSKYFDLMLGNNNAIIFNSKYYKIVLLLGLSLVFLTISLNTYFIPLYSIKGVAIATLISISIYSLAKLLFVVKRMHLFPFTIQTIYSLIITAILFLSFYYWEFPYQPLISICLKSFLLAISYIFINYKLVISHEINDVIKTIIKFFNHTKKNDL